MAVVFVVGAGRFGRNYLTVLAALQQQNKALEMRNSPNAFGSQGSRLPRIDTIVLSRTRSAAAEAMAARTALLPACPFERVVGVEVRDLYQLNEALARYQPDLTCIVARDRQVGDDIHAQYAEPALNVGKVLCEKPFHHTRGDGASLNPLRTLLQHPRADCFGLELPMTVLGSAMAEDQRIGAMLRNARQIDFVWEKQAHGTDLIDDLLLHPWSLIPATWQTAVKQAHATEKSVILELLLKPDAPDQPDPFDEPDPSPKPDNGGVRCNIRLSSGGVFRGMCIDGQPFQFIFDQGRLQLWEICAPWQDVITGRADQASRRISAAVENPLAQHIRAALRGHPLVDIHRTYRSQTFLESVAGAVREPPLDDVVAGGS
jgi:hypothetical protein